MKGFSFGNPFGSHNLTGTLYCLSRMVQHTVDKGLSEIMDNLSLSTKDNSKYTFRVQIDLQDNDNLSIDVIQWQIQGGQVILQRKLGVV